MSQTEPPFLRLSPKSDLTQTSTAASDHRHSVISDFQLMFTFLSRLSRTKNLKMAPPKYGDLGKQASDVFGKGYHFGLLKLDVSFHR